MAFLVQSSFLQTTFKIGNVLGVIKAGTDNLSVVPRGFRRAYRRRLSTNSDDRVTLDLIRSTWQIMMCHMQLAGPSNSEDTFLPRTENQERLKEQRHVRGNAAQLISFNGCSGWRPPFPDALVRGCSNMGTGWVTCGRWQLVA